MSSLVNPLVIPGASNPGGSQVSMPAPFAGTTASGGSTNPYMNTSTASTTAPNYQSLRRQFWCIRISGEH